ncbi:Epoxyqueuosine reductase [Aquisphaera giovannonii]|uniref:Epoxyqueuosine reductase n=1 Tax=Aquisphaera giovannonii TaxID=406548 RepID=A0A5B9WBS0_9BACT|nr:tRNA epoxyqueuosine(34) reductase QueG [Aquisphaera giovannonii]QEH38022.1 Epoxyqueuosine reductase [Aquisphaera giovannonii]
MTPSELSQALKAEALRLGFDGVGIAPAVSPPGYEHYLDWLRAERHAGMRYMERQAEARRHPGSVLDGVRSVVMLSAVYGRPGRGGEAAPSDDPARGKIARYALGEDYHRVLWIKLDALLGWLEGVHPGVRGRGVVDTAPLLERDYARLAGLGWVGKNTMLIDRRLGSFTFLGALLVDVELAPDEPHARGHCGTCTRCLDACPTDAFAGPYQLDASRCISYWTIEHRGPVPGPIAERLDGWVFGCDVCQDVCPWNRKAPGTRMPELDGTAEVADGPRPDLLAWLDRDEDAWSEALRGTALKRAKRAGLVRNAALVLGTRRVAEAVPSLGRRLADEAEEPAARAAAAWALGSIGGDRARDALMRGRHASPDSVREAVVAAEAAIDLRDAATEGRPARPA